MLNLLGFEEFPEVLPFLLVPMFFVVVFVVIIVSVVKRAKAEQRKREINEGQQRQSQYPFTDGNGRTEQQRDYLNAKRRELSERKAAAKDGSHSHSGKRETYDKIVGSLGEINDEGCYELDGVRLIEHDEAYCNDPDHIINTEPTELERAIVLGEVLNEPRFKQMYRRK